MAPWESALVVVVVVCCCACSAAGRAYNYYSYEDIVRRLHVLEENYPSIFELTSAQAKYHLPSPGWCGKTLCQQWIMRVTNEETLPEPERPEVFFSGELHGNERIGPTTLVVLLELLADSYYGGISGNSWLNHLVDTRVMYFMPATNALGYYMDRRGERGIDPNRDFPIDNLNGNCMRTIAARALNELWREHLFQLSITFHGGMRAIAYEWGTLSNRFSRISPDDAAQIQIGAGLSDFAGKFREGKYYPHNRLNDIVYPVRGGMEDWAYAASWAKNTRPCTPNTFGGYPREKTVYTSQQMRAFNILVETSNQKTPRVADLGTDEELLLPNGRGNGHIPQNVRLALLTADIVQPYMKWINGHRGCAKGSLLAPNLLGGSQCGKQQTLKPLKVSKGSVLTLSWDIGGGFHVDSTRLVIAKWPANIPFEAVHQQEYREFPGFGFSERELHERLEIVNMSEPQTGNTRWANVRGDRFANRARFPFFPSWSDCIAAPEVSGRYVVFAVTEMDSAWGQRAAKASPRLGPQSHIVNARTNPSW